MASCRESNCQPLNVLALATSGQRSWAKHYDPGKKSHLTLARRYGHCSGERGISACPSGAWPPNGARLCSRFSLSLDTWLRSRSKGAEALMRDEHFRVMFVNSPLPTLVLDNARKILDVNAALCEMWGFPRSQFVGRPTHFRRIRSNTTRKNGANFYLQVRQSDNVISAIRLAPCWEFNMRSKAFLPD